MVKPTPANLETSIEDLTEHNLLYRLLIGIEGLSNSQAEAVQEIVKLPLAVHKFMQNEDHGLAHSKKVLIRCREIVKNCPQLMLDLEIQGLGPIEIEELFTWASILHDLTRFLGYETISAHQLAGANLARSAFGQGDHHPLMAQKLMEMIICHDYLCTLVDNESLPNIFKQSPLAEMFRLADKTSLSPEDEIYRYYLTGLRLNGSFFKPMPFNERVIFAKSCLDSDMLTWFLILFAIQPDDFYFPETQRIYRQWSFDKPGAAKKIIKLAELENLTPKQIQEVIRVIDSFHHFIEQPSPF